MIKFQEENNIAQEKALKKGVSKTMQGLPWWLRLHTSTTGGAGSFPWLGN